MKKIILCVILMASGLNMFAQEENAFGIAAGYSSFIVKAKASYQGNSESESTSAGGFYVGIFKEFDINEKFTIRPEFQYARYSKDGETSSELLIPVMFQFEVAKAFSLLVGPQFDYLLDDDADDFNKFGLGLAVGAEIDFTSKLFLNLRYSFGISERIKDEEIYEPFEIDMRFSTFNLGVGYRF